MKFLRHKFFNRIGKVNIIPVSFKIVLVFTLFILVTNLTTNYISLVFNRVQQISSAKLLLLKDLKELANYSNIQWQIFKINHNKEMVIQNIRSKSQFELGKHSIFMGFQASGKILFSSSNKVNKKIQIDQKSLNFINQQYRQKIDNNFMVMMINNEKYFGIYKYNKNWEVFLFRGEKYDAFLDKTWANFQQIILIIIVITSITLFVGIAIVKGLLRYIGVISDDIRQMVKEKELSLINLDKAPNDDITYMGLAFNTLSNNLTHTKYKLEMLIDMGIALNAEKDEKKLMEMILLAAKDLANADGGTLYILEEDKLRLEIVRNDSLKIALGGKSGVEVDLPTIQLRNPENGIENHKSIVSHSVLLEKTVNIPDAYADTTFDFTENQNFDKNNAYHSKSFLTIPMKTRGGEVIGAFQLINAQDNKGQTISFDKETEVLVEAIAAQATVALENYNLSKNLELKVKKRTQFISTLLDSQEQLIITTDGNQLQSCNQSLLQYFQVNSTEEFKKAYGECICETFDSQAPTDYLQKKVGQQTWIDYIISNPDINHKVQMVHKHSTNIFSVTASDLPAGEDLKISVFTDITEMEKAKKALEEIHKHTQESIEYASLIQGTLIPDDKILKQFFSDYFTIWHPKDVVGGDIYLIEELNENEIIIMVIDCTGHGVPGAFVTMMVKAIERQLTSKLDTITNISPAKILGVFNKSIKQLLKQETIDSVSNAGFDGGILYYNKKQKFIRFAGAETPLFIFQDDELKMIKGNRHSIGYKKSDINYEFTDHTIDVSQPTQVYLTTDGYLDQNGGEKSFPFGKKRFKQLIVNNQKQSMPVQKEIILDSLNEYQQADERNDDVTVIGLKL